MSTSLQVNREDEEAGSSQNTLVPSPFPCHSIPLSDAADRALLVFAPSGPVPKGWLEPILRDWERQGFFVYPVSLPQRDFDLLLRQPNLPSSWSGKTSTFPALDPSSPSRVLQFLRRNLKTLEFALDSPTLSPSLRLAMLADLLEEGLFILHQSHGYPWREDPGTHDRWRSLLDRVPTCPAGIVDTYCMLRGAALLASIQHRLLLRPCRCRIDLEPVRVFYRWLEDHVVESHMESHQRRRRGLVLRLVAWSPVPVVLISIALYVLVTWPEEPVQAPLVGRTGGIVGEYFAGTEFESKLLERMNRTIDFSTEAAFGSGVPADDFSARWEGLMSFPEKGSYSLCVESDDGNRLYFHGRLLFEDWEVHPAKKTCKTVHVKAGWHPFRLEYFEQRGDAVLKLLRKGPSTELEVVPSRDLCCRDKP